MSTYLGDTLLAGVATNTVKNAHTLLDFKWSDHLLNNQEWLRADTFSWQSGTVYSEAYQLLLDEYNNGTTEQDERGLTFKRTPSGYKITTPANDTALATRWAEGRDSWFYILDTTNQRFKLPRTKYGFVGLRDTVGNYVPESLPNVTGHTHYSVHREYTGGDGPFSNGGESTTAYGGGGTYNTSRDYFDLSSANSVYQNGASVQQKSTQMYLYFYVGQFSQSATEQTAGLNSELFNQKVDVASLVECRTVIETYKNGSSWYRLWSDGWVEQGGIVSGAYSDNYHRLVTFIKRMSDTNYCVTLTGCSPDSTNFHYDSYAVCTYMTGGKTDSQMIIAQSENNAAKECIWKVEGYAA